MLILPEVSQLRNVFREVGEAGEGPHLVAGVEAEPHLEVVVVVVAEVVVVHDLEVVAVEAGVEEVLHWEVVVAGEKVEAVQSLP